MKKDLEKFSDISSLYILLGLPPAGLMILFITLSNVRKLNFAEIILLALISLFLMIYGSKEIRRIWKKLNP